MYKKELIYNPGKHTFYKESVRSGAFVSCAKKQKTVSSLGYWHDCRESFAPSFKKDTKHFLFAHRPNNGTSILNFINDFERRLKLKSFTQLVGCSNRVNSRNSVGATMRSQKTGISLVIPSSFWKRTNLRRQLFTILLRCGRNYKGNFEQALYSHSYTKRTKVAIEKFLKGKTRYRGKINGGWVSTFCPTTNWWGNVSRTNVKANLNKLY